ncbi:MAG: hypothetical protein JSW61_05320 [Candidatus Thorarchaeota archaeon]|nr:MAG: hypothetical protein JSW61_05320 [Candidatus Thorarchaeota archaeon]
MSDLNTRRASDLEWVPFGLTEKLETLTTAVIESQREAPSQNTRLVSKLMKWSKQLEYIRLAVDKITHDLQPEVQNALGLIIEETELFQIIMFQPSTKNLFLEIKAHYLAESELPLTERQMEFLISTSELSRVIALVGDGAISMAVLHQLWSPESDEVGTMTERRAGVVSNENLARVCDRWNLYEHRIHFDPPTPTKSEIEHIKGTLVEAVYGIIYIERGLDGVKDSIRHLKMASNDVD